MTIEGFKQFENIRDFLYTRMRGVKDRSSLPAPPAASLGASAGGELLAVLGDIRDELRAVREQLERGRGGPHG
jgi:putative membrane protein